MKYLQAPTSYIHIHLYIPISHNSLLSLHLSYIDTCLSYIIPRQKHFIQSTCLTLEYIPFKAISSHFKPYNLQGCIFYKVTPLQVIPIDQKVAICYNYKRQGVTPETLRNVQQENILFHKLERKSIFYIKAINKLYTRKSGIVSNKTRLTFTFQYIDLFDIYTFRQKDKRKVFGLPEQTERQKTESLCLCEVRATETLQR